MVVPKETEMGTAPKGTFAEEGRSVSVSGLVTDLALLLSRHDQKKSDLSIRAEGTCQAISVAARQLHFDDTEKLTLHDAVITCFAQYSQLEPPIRGSERRWPSNRYAEEALQALGFKRPVAHAA
jgi:hypothetical protein